MGSVERIGISIDSGLLERFDSFIARRGYTNRSEAVRDLIRDKLVEEEWAGGKKEAMGALTLVYNHASMELAQRLTEAQHKNHATIVSALHVHIDEHNCLEVLIRRGKGGEIKSLGDRLISTRGVKHGKLTLTTTGKGLA